MGVTKLNLEDYTGAIADFTKAIENNPKYVNGYFNRGIAKGNLNDNLGAIAAVSFFLYPVS
ncbi:MAG: tetratricopeptide repeat protein [Ferruginibacter sp.]|nr:tetratricopeptide repeat protein [Ferruginibacter sp.]